MAILVDIPHYHMPRDNIRLIYPMTVDCLKWFSLYKDLQCREYKADNCKNRKRVKWETKLLFIFLLHWRFLSRLIKDVKFKLTEHFACLIDLFLFLITVHESNDSREITVHESNIREKLQYTRATYSICLMLVFHLIYCKTCFARLWGEELHYFVGSHWSKMLLKRLI